MKKSSNCNSEPRVDSQFPHIAFLTYATQFSDAASVIVDSGRISKARIAATYLYGHAIELALKSILVWNGIPIDEIRKKFRHNLKKCLKKAASYPEGACIDNSIREIVSLLNPVYQTKFLEYHPGNMLMQLPCEATMHAAVNNLIRRLRARYTPSRPLKR